MTKARMMELLDIEMQCVKRASGYEYDLAEQGWIQTGDICNRDCANCELVQDSKELLDMYLATMNELRMMMVKEGNWNWDEYFSYKDVPDMDLEDDYYE